MEKTFKVVDVPASEFDAFISEVVEEIKNVDRAIWPIFQKWRVINACLSESVLILVELPDGTLKLEVPPAEPEQNSPSFLEYVARAREIMRVNPAIESAELAQMLGLKSKIYAHQVKVFVNASNNSEED